MKNGLLTCDVMQYGR